MTDRWVALLALIALGSAWASPPVPVLAAIVLAVAAGWLARCNLRASAIVLAVAVAAVVGGRANNSLVALAEPLPPRLEGIAQLASDPELQRFGTQFVIRFDGRRYVATAALEDSSVVRSLLTGDRVAVSGRPRPLRGAPPGWVRAGHLAGRVELDEVSAVPGTTAWYGLANAVHRTLTAGATSLGESSGPLYTGLVMGDDRGQSDLVTFRFQAAGLSHLLAVSGQNVAFLLAVAAPVLRRLPPKTQVLAGLALLGLFTLVTRAEPSVLRAGVMAAIALFAVTTGRVVPGTRILSMAVVVLLALDPLLVHSIGFRLSICATAGLLSCTRPVAEWLPGPDWLRLPLAVTLVAQAATAPVLLGFAGGVPAAATVANMLAVPAAGLVMMLGVSIGAVAGLVREPIAAVLQLPARWLVYWIEWVAAVASRSPLPLLGPIRLSTLAAAVGLVVVRQRLDSPRVVRALAAGAALCVLVALWPVAPSVGRQDVVPGASLWVGRCGARVVVLGPVDDIGGLLEQLWTLGVRRIDVVAVDDSISAMRAAQVVDEQFSVRRVVTSAERSPAGVVPIGTGSISVGGLRIAAAPDAAVGAGSRTRSGSLTRMGVSEAPCSF